MKKENYLEILNEHFEKINQANLINQQIINSGANNQIKNLCKHSYVILDNEIKRISQLILLMQKE